MQLLDYIVNMSGYRREYVQCPICSRSYPLKFIEEHASACVSGVSSATKSSAAEKSSQRKQARKPKTTTNAFSFLSKSSKKLKKGSDKSGAKSSEVNGIKHVKKKQKRGSSNFGRPRKELQVRPWIKDHRLSGQTKWGEKGKILGWNLTSGLSTVRGRNRVKSGDSLKIFRELAPDLQIIFGEELQSIQRDFIEPLSNPKRILREQLTILKDTLMNTL